MKNGKNWLRILVMVLIFGMTVIGCDTSNDDDGAEITWNGRIYRRIDRSMTWHEAQAHAESLGGHLATITSAAEQAAIYNLIRNGGRYVYWIGAQRINDNWTWVTGEQWGYTNWAPGEPNNMDGEENYVFMFRLRNGTWNDIRNTGEVDYGVRRFGFVIEWGNN